LVQTLQKKTPENVTYSQVMLAHQAVAKAQLNYVELLQEFDKAELRLMILLGPGAKCPVIPATPVLPAAPPPKSPYNERLSPPSELKIETPSP
jgi:outer membrane protein TolC